MAFPQDGSDGGGTVRTVHPELTKFKLEKQARCGKGEAVGMVNPVAGDQMGGPRGDRIG